MNIVEFYKKLSSILEMCREKSISQKESENRLKNLLDQAKISGLDVNVYMSILNTYSLVDYDDEKSYEEESYEESYDESDEESSY